MAKGMGGMPGGFDFGNMGNILKQAQDMQKKMAKVQEDLKERVVEGSSGGGLVTATANGAQQLVAIKISKEAVDPSDIPTLEDLVVAAANAALKKAKELHEKELGKVTGGLNLPGLM